MNLRNLGALVLGVGFLLSGCSSPSSPEPSSADLEDAASGLSESVPPSSHWQSGPLFDEVLTFDGINRLPRKIPFELQETSRVSYEVAVGPHVAVAHIAKVTNPDYAFDTDPTWVPSLGGPVLGANATLAAGPYRLIVDCFDFFPCEARARLSVEGRDPTLTSMGGRKAVFQPPDCRERTALAPSEGQLLPAWQPAEDAIGNHVVIERSGQDPHVTRYGAGEFIMSGRYDDGRAHVSTELGAVVMWIDVGLHCIAPFVGAFGNVSTEFIGIPPLGPALIVWDGECAGEPQAAFIIDEVGYHDDLWGRLERITFRFELGCSNSTTVGKVVWRDDAAPT